MSNLQVRIGTRASKLAQWQASWVAGELRRLGASVELVEITTRGDRRGRSPVVHLDEPGIFTKEIQSALLARDVDVAVHSLKDLPTQETPGLALAAIPSREDPADALVSNVALSLTGLPPAARVGTGSPRRRAQVRHLRSDLELVDIRGNVDTRLRKLDDGDCDALVLAAAGLRRLGLDERITELLAPPRILPAPGQGALAIECRVDDSPTRTLLSQLDDGPSREVVEVERMLLAALGAGCSAPVGAWGRVEAGQLVLDGLVADLDGQQVLRASLRGAAGSGAQLSRIVADDLLRQGARELIEAARTC